MKIASLLSLKWLWRTINLSILYQNTHHFKYVTSNNLLDVVKVRMLSEVIHAGRSICMNTKVRNMVSLITLSDVVAKAANKCLLFVHHVTGHVIKNEH